MATIRDFIAQIATCKDTSELNKIANDLIKTPHLDEEKNTRVAKWIQDGKDFGSFKTHLIFMLQIAERSLLNHGVGSLEDFYERVFVCDDREHLKRIVRELKTKPYLSTNQVSGIDDFLLKEKPFEVVRRNLLILLNTAKQQRKTAVPADLEESAKQAGDKHFLPPLKTRAADLPESDQQRLYEQALREGFEHTVERFIENTLDKISLYQENPNATKMEDIRSNVHCLIELFQNQIHVDFVKKNPRYFDFNNDKIEKLRRIQNFIEDQKSDTPLYLWYEYFRFSEKCGVREPWYLAKDLAKNLLNENFEPKTLNAHTYTSLLMVGHPKLSRIAVPSKNGKLTLPPSEVVRLYSLAGKKVFGLLPKESISRLIHHLNEQIEQDTIFSQDFLQDLLPYINRKFLEEKLKKLPDNHSKRLLQLCILHTDLGGCNIVFSNAKWRDDFREEFTRIFEHVLKNATDSIKAFTEGKQTTAHVVKACENLLKVLKAMTEAGLQALGECFEEVKAIQRFLDEKGAGKKLPVLWYYGRTLVSYCLKQNQNHLILTKRKESQNISIEPVDYPPSVDTSDSCIYTNSLESFLKPKFIFSYYTNYSLEVIKAAFLFQHPDRKSLGDCIKQRLSTDELRELFIFSAKNSLTELTALIFQNKNFSALENLRNEIRIGYQSVALMALKFVPNDQLLRENLLQPSPFLLAIHCDMPEVEKAIYDRVSQNGKDWTNFLTNLPFYIKHCTSAAVSIIAVLPRHFLFAPIQGGTLLTYAEKHKNAAVVEKIREKLNSGTELERVLKAREANTRSAASNSTAVGLVTDAPAPSVSMSTSSTRSQGARAAQDFSGPFVHGGGDGCAIV